MIKTIHNRNNRKTFFVQVASVFIMLGVALLAFSGCAAASETAYYPVLKVIGDVNNVVQLSAAKSDKPSIKTQSFKFDDKTYTGYLLTDLLHAADLPANDAQVYFQGFDGMMSSISVGDLDKNYIVFGSNGWEAMNVDYPPSCNVKEIADIIVVADNPEAVPAAVKVKDDSGQEKTVSPGMLLVGDYTVARHFEGESEKAGKSVRVYTSAQYVSIGGNKLTVTDNKIEMS